MITNEQYEILRRDLATLSEETREMNERMSGLAGALTDVGDLQAAQLRTTRRVEQVAQGTVTKAELAALQRQRSNAMRNLYAALGTVVVAAMAIGVGGLAASRAYAHQQTVLRRAQYDNCMVRNVQLAGSRALTDKLILAETKSTDTATAQDLIRDLNEAKAKAQPIDCSNLLKK